MMGYETTVVAVTWPELRGWSLDHACQKMGLADPLGDFRRRIDLWHAFQRLPAPIVGVVGLLNAGKSSAVKRFLSGAGRTRILTGWKSEQGTQRFVFWLPEAWRNESALWASFQEEMEAVFGSGYEELAEDPALASAQYNARGDVEGKFGIPLVGFDPALDRLGFGMLDCPDFERSEGERVKFVRRALTMLSAVLLVVERSKVEARKTILEPFRDFRDLGTFELPLYLLVNMVPPSEKPCELLADIGVKHLADEARARHVFIAFHGNHHGADEAIPPCCGRDVSGDRGLPCFFKPRASEDKYRPDDVDPDDLLQAHLARLAPAQLWERKRAEQLRTVREGLVSLRKKIKCRLDDQRKGLSAKAESVVRFIGNRLAGDGGKLAFPMPPAVAGKLLDGFQRTAPTYAWPSMKIVRVLSKLMESAKNLIRQGKTLIAPGDAVSEKLKEGKRQIERLRSKTAVDPVAWARQFQDLKAVPDGLTVEELEKVWVRTANEAISVVPEIDDGVVDSFCATIWKQLPWYKKIAFTLTGPFLLMAAIVAAAMSAIDGGGSIILFFSLKELLVTAGLAGLGAASLVLVERLEKHLAERAGVPFFQTMVTAALDSFGLPRETVRDLKMDFSNTGECRVLAQIPPLERIVDLAEDRVLGSIAEEGWKAWERELSEDPDHPALPTPIDTPSNQ